MKRFKFVALATGLIALGYILRDAVNFMTYLKGGKVELCTIPAPIHDAEIAIVTDSWQDNGQALYYEVRIAAC